MGHKYVKEDETFTTLQNGVVPKPTAQEVTDNKVLRADGSWVAQSGGGGGAVTSVNGKTGDVTLDASDVGALPDDTPLFSGSYNDLTDKPTIPTAYTNNPEMDGTTTPGSSSSYARGDHVHPSDTSKQNDIGLSIIDGKICQTYETS